MPEVILAPERLPVHVGIIMDGNGRWAARQALPRTRGHEEGLKAVKKIVAEAATLGVRYVTLYTFSTENWKRAQEEVGFLMNLVRTHLRNEFAFYKENGIRIRHIGDMAGLPAPVAEEIQKAMDETAAFNNLTVALAINYGGRDELERAASRFARDKGKARDESSLSAYLDFPELPDCDLIIRTGGEKRISNFLLWQGAYAELSFSDTLWPDYTIEEFRQNLADFGRRNRRFGGVRPDEGGRQV
jgi:undecaprenyl diphosphate synthase